MNQPQKGESSTDQQGICRLASKSPRQERFSSSSTYIAGP